MKYKIYAFENQGLFFVTEKYKNLNGNCIKGKFKNKGRYHHFILNDLDRLIKN